MVKGIRKEFVTQSKTKQKCLELLKKVKILFYFNYNCTISNKLLSISSFTNKNVEFQKKKTVKNHVAVFNNTFGVEAGEVLGLLGPNGAGKTTTLNIIMAEVTPTAGQVSQHAKHGY